ncbi:3-hydroxyacyl-CoA dehydrogenase/enoyl-CoA hydratase family protein [Hugenholtzia roseola]|uniref:3-hydroxyacyl-CoA dehydrogenase/enoyl-CoA hydratase family protein n=1 Tax=Hugenholtzia roseola TaxID=1002 RepID=UPI0004232220|nr:3-hydroxyacyl-CoA dehydrogenase/enoyl-CoA hydratase family protein [Hugenholtzia roseola]
MSNTATATAVEKKAAQRHIRKVAILGSGVMGSRIACHFANIGCEVVLLDIVPFDLKEADQNNAAARNALVNKFLTEAIKSKPAPLYHAGSAKLIKTGNLTDNLEWIADCDLILEAVIERLDIKQQLFERVEKYRRADAIVASNTSGIPMNMLIAGRSEAFQKHFCGMHFFNPPRYLRLLEIIPSAKTDPEIVKFLLHYGDLYLGKETVLCKDTPAFIANRVGVFAIMSTLHAVEKYGLTVGEVDKLTGTIIGRAKSATFRTLDVVGLDTTIKVAKGLADNLPNDEQKHKFALPAIVSELEKRGWFGDKTKQGYYKKVKSDSGKSDILELDLTTYEYKAAEKADIKLFGKLKDEDDLKKRFPILIKDESKYGEFFRTTFYEVFAYVSNRVPEIADHLYQIDKAVCAGFGWEIGAFEIWDTLGVAQTAAKIKEAGLTVAAWVEEMIAAGCDTFYRTENGKKQYYDINTKSYQNIAGTEDFIILDALRKTNKVWGNDGTTVHDLGDGILGLEFHTKMNAIGAEVIEGIHTAINLAEKDFRGLVIGNDAPNYSAGANLAMLYMYALEQEYDEVEMMIRQFQNAMMRIRYSAIPVVTAPAGLVLGGGCESILHADHVQAHAESYVGLVEVGVGLIPAGGGTKEMVLRTADSFVEGDPKINRLQQIFMNIATAKVATSAEEAREMGYLRKSDSVTYNRSRLLADAKQAAIELYEAGYTQPVQRTDIFVEGRSALATFTAGAVGMLYGHYATEHDIKIAKKLAYVICGGDLSGSAYVSEQYLLDLEREAFLSLTAEPKTLERIQSILFKGKPLRN